MKKLLTLVLIGCLSGSALAQTNAKPATSAPNAPASPVSPASATAPAPAPATPASAATTGVVGDRNADYTDRIPPEQIIALEAGGDKFRARHIADLSGLPRGAVIVLHDSGHHPDWPFTAAALIDDLPLHGWDTLSIELPAPSIEPKKIESTTNAAAPPTNNSAPAGSAKISATAPPASTAAPAPTGIEAQAQARINAAIKFFSDQNQRNIVLIGFGSGAIRAAENLRLLAAPNTSNPGATAPLTALVMIAPEQQLNSIEMDLPKLLPLTGISTLDMILENEPQARADAEARRRAVLHQRTRIYTRLELPPLNNASDAQHSAMVKRVRSWLQVNAHEPLKPAAQKTPNPSQQ